MRHWLMPVPLYQGELLSGWLVRAALAQGCDPRVLTSTLWPGWRAWSRDLDRGLRADRMQTLSNACGIDAAQLQAASVQPILEKIVGPIFRNDQTWPWILTLGTRGERRRGGLQFCPACFSSDAQPHYRQRWRAAWHVACVVHQCMLVDRCPQCRLPLEPHRLCAEDGGLDFCQACHTHLSKGVLECCDSRALALQVAADRALAHGHGPCGGTELPVGAWFGVLKGLIVRSPVGLKPRSVDVPAAGAEAIALGFRLELLDVSARQLLLGRAWERLQSMDTDEASALSCARLPRSPALRVTPMSPEAAGDPLLGMPRSRAVVERAWHRFIRRHRLTG